MDSNNVRWVPVGWFVVFVLAAIFVSGLAGLVLRAIPYNFSSSPAIALTILLSTGIVSLVGVLTIAVAVLTALGLADPGRAFGMPEGTIRAVIALSLILIFSIMSVFLYQTLREPKTSTAILTTAQFSEIPGKEIISSQPVENKPGFYEVQRVYQNEASDDFAKQLLTTLSTLVVAVAGFYFGTRAVSVARGKEAQLLPVIKKLNPPEGQQGDEIPEAEILGKNFSSLETVKLVSEKDEKIEMTLVDILSSKTRIQGKINISASQEKGTYALIVVNADGGEDRLGNAFTVT